MDELRTISPNLVNMFDYASIWNYFVDFDWFYRFCLIGQHCLFLLLSILINFANFDQFGQCDRFWSIWSILVNLIDFGQFDWFWSMWSILINMIDYGQCDRFLCQIVITSINIIGAYYIVNFGHYCFCRFWSILSMLQHLFRRSNVLKPSLLHLSIIAKSSSSRDTIWRRRCGW